MPIRLRKLPVGLDASTPKPEAVPKARKGRKREVGESVPLEREIQRDVVKYLKLIGATVVRVNSGMQVVAATATKKARAVRYNSAPGCSDLLVALRGRFVAIECKRPGNVPTALQREFLASVQRSGGVAIFVVSVADLESKLRLEGLL
jgi:hypothetical protein